MGSTQNKFKGFATASVCVCALLCVKQRQKEVCVCAGFGAEICWSIQLLVTLLLTSFQWHFPMCFSVIYYIQSAEQNMSDLLEYLSSALFYSHSFTAYFFFLLGFLSSHSTSLSSLFHSFTSAIKVFPPTLPFFLFFSLHLPS